MLSREIEICTLKTVYLPMKHIRKGDEAMNKEIDALAREAKRAYYRKWNAKNKDRVREYQRRYWQRKAEKEMKKREARGNGFHE